MNFRIQEASESDIPMVLELYAQPAFDDGQVLSLSEALEIFRTFRKYPYYKIFVMFDQKHEGKIVATYALLKMDNLGHLGKPSAIIEDVVVAPEYQGKGLGKMLMQHAMDTAQILGCYKLVLSSNIKRKNAHAFYESLGFDQHGISFKVNP